MLLKDNMREINIGCFIEYLIGAILGIGFWLSMSALVLAFS